MKRFVGLSLAAGVLFTCMAASSGQAAPVSGAGAKLAPAAGIVSQVYWRHRQVAAWLSPLPLVMTRPRNR